MRSVTVTVYKPFSNVKCYCYRHGRIAATNRHKRCKISKHKQMTESKNVTKIRRKKEREEEKKMRTSGERDTNNSSEQNRAELVEFQVTLPHLETLYL